MTRSQFRRGALAAMLSAVLAVSGLTAIAAPAAAATTTTPASATTTSATAAAASAPAASAPAATASDFDPGNIISDANFFNGNAMSAGAVQNFLNAQVSSCRAGYTCLKDYKQSTWTRPADAMCNTYTGAGNESAATIIAKVGQACNVSQSVLIVLLQKEQSLVTDSWPSQSQYTSATGFACPDTAPCDAEYSGFYNQVYKAAWQYKRYSNPPGTSAFFNWFPVGKYSNVRYHPNAACGSSPVLIQNQATAGLYYYTPYQPNAVAMSNVYGGQTDGCSSYGNRNFWRLYTDWFGDPRGSNNPHGAFDTAAPVAGGVLVTGWAVDPASDAPVNVTVSVDGVASTLTANVRLDWIPVLYPSLSPNHGFSGIVGASPGNHTVCVAKANGADLGCKSVTVASTTAAGYLDTADGVVGGVHIAGWSLNKASAAQTYIWVDIDGVGQPFKVDKQLSWTPALYPNIGNTHGYDRVVPAAPGKHQVCVYGFASVLLGCKTAYVPSNEAGTVESATGVLGAITVSGWSLDKRTTASTYVWVDVDGTGKAVYAADNSETAGAAWPSTGKRHGFTTSIAAKPGNHQVCVFGTLENTSYGCRTVTVPHNEVGSFDSATGVMGGINVSGWSLDQTKSDSTYVWVTIDGGGGGAIWAGGKLNWIEGLYPGKGPRHGFSGFFSASAGVHNVCVVGTSENVSYGCKQVTVPSSGAASWDTLTATEQQINLTGWAVDRISTDIKYVWVTVDGVGGPYMAGEALNWIDGYFPGVGPRHGFNITIKAGAGPHTVCVVATYDNQDLGCRTVEVPSTGATSIDSVTGVKGGVRITGWSVDRNSTATTYIWVNIDGVGTAIAAASKLDWINAYFPGVGPNHGIDSTLPASSGSHQVCITATFDNRNMGCSTVTVP
ncbi:hypothetical protein [Herbiconiux daphne]|uniref:Uncharacterized protein n=1 Tax=Herbiconiux daphne TaxID=2970914 RepID=A0ABT2H4N5_9MICO|nr:hypothetical protein [Herbiconiux daphne]MCS5734894.1 hypothetical protein [Herbiconiux daphne]